jgi:ferritin-like metal-binding protein YciE
MAVKSMQDLLLEELRDIYSAERIASRAYPKLRKALVTGELGQAVERHLEETKGQIERLGQIFDKLETRSRGKTCHAMEGLVEEAQEHLEKDLAPELLEVALVAELQKMEHYEIAAYGSARAHAEALGLSEVVGLLDETLEEEKKTEQLLNDLALRTVNPKAVELGR